MNPGYEWTRDLFARAALRSRRASQKLTTVESMIAGAIAGSATVLITNPIWVINTRMTARTAETNSTLPTQSSTSKASRKPSTLRTVFTLFREEGFAAFFAGVLPALVLVINPILQYTIFEQLKDALEKRRGKILPRDAFFLGAIGKLLATSITYPYITVKSRMHVAQRDTPQDSIIGSLKRIVREEGWAGLYKGILICFFVLAFFGLRGLFAGWPQSTVQELAPKSPRAWLPPLSFSPSKMRCMLQAYRQGRMCQRGFRWSRFFPKAFRFRSGVNFFKCQCWCFRRRHIPLSSSFSDSASAVQIFTHEYHVISIHLIGIISCLAWLFISWARNISSKSRHVFQFYPVWRRTAFKILSLFVLWIIFRPEVRCSIYQSAFTLLVLCLWVFHSPNQARRALRACSSFVFRPSDFSCHLATMPLSQMHSATLPLHVRCPLVWLDFWTVRLLANEAIKTLDVGLSKAVHLPLESMLFVFHSTTSLFCGQFLLARHFFDGCRTKPLLFS